MSYTAACLSGVVPPGDLSRPSLVIPPSGDVDANIDVAGCNIANACRSAELVSECPSGATSPGSTGAKLAINFDASELVRVDCVCGGCEASEGEHLRLAVWLGLT
jgi:hypothetical protein